MIVKCMIRAMLDEESNDELSQSGTCREGTVDVVLNSYVLEYFVSYEYMKHETRQNQ